MKREGAGSRIKNLATDVKVMSRSSVVFGVSSCRVKNKCLWVREDLISECPSHRCRCFKMSYQECSAKVTDVMKNGDVVSTTLEVTEVPSYPPAPAGLYSDKPDNHEAIQLHKLAKIDGKTLTYETYKHQGLLPKLGDVYIFRLWWTPDQLEAVKDTFRSWALEEYPENSDHTHCLLTWETIGAKADHKIGYRSGRDWITEEAYKTYIVDDLLRVRHRSECG
jgi:hypothetical protein